jgi:hypothetical protein
MMRKDEKRKLLEITLFSKSTHEAYIVMRTDRDNIDGVHSQCLRVQGSAPPPLLSIAYLFCRMNLKLNEVCPIF